MSQQLPPTPSFLSYVSPTETSPWGTYLSQVDRVVPYLGHLGKWAETLKRPTTDWLGHDHTFYDAFKPEARKLFWQ